MELTYQKHLQNYIGLVTLLTIFSCEIFHTHVVLLITIIIIIIIQFIERHLLNASEALYVFSVYIQNNMVTYLNKSSLKNEVKSIVLRSCFKTATDFDMIT